MGQITPQPGIMDIALYQGGESKIDGANRVTKLSSNENPLGPSPAAKTAYLEAVEDLALYPTTDHRALREAIAQVNDLDADRIICGAGSDEIIAFLCNAYAGPGDEVLHTEHGFLMYAISARAAGALPVVAAEAERVSDVSALIAAMTDKTRLVFIANPNNPTGTMISAAEVERLADALPDQALLVLDGAYAEFVSDANFDAGASLVETRENVVMTRTFSKIYGLGGLRVGWGYAPRHVIDTLNRIRGPFNVSSAGLAAAQAAVLDQDYTARCRDENAKWRDWLSAQLAQIAIPSDPSHANFVLARFADEDQAVRADQWLRKGSLIVRHPKSYGLAECLRITIGDETACRAVIKFLTEFMESERA